jgi:hypothetical protein
VNQNCNAIRPIIEDMQLEPQNYLGAEQANARQWASDT